MELGTSYLLFLFRLFAHFLSLSSLASHFRYCFPPALQLPSVCSCQSQSPDPLTHQHTCSPLSLSPLHAQIQAFFPQSVARQSNVRPSLRVPVFVPVPCQLYLFLTTACSQSCPSTRCLLSLPSMTDYLLLNSALKFQSYTDASAYTPEGGNTLKNCNCNY